MGHTEQSKNIGALLTEKVKETKELVPVGKNKNASYRLCDDLIIKDEIVDKSNIINIPENIINDSLSA